MDKKRFKYSLFSFIALLAFVGVEAPVLASYSQQHHEFISDDIQVLDIYNDLIVVRINSKEEFEIYMNNKIRPREGN